MRPIDIEFASEVLSCSTYTINNWDFTFKKSKNIWKCKMDEVGDLIELIEKSFRLPINYDQPPIKIKSWRRLITIKQEDNHIQMQETLMRKFLEELKMVYDVYA